MGSRPGAVAALDLDARAFRGRSVLVTGGSGLMGCWLVPALLGAGASVCVLRAGAARVSALALQGVQDDVDVVVGDVCELALIERLLADHAVDTVFHLAAQTIVGTANRAPLATFETNVRGTWIVLEACRRAHVARVVVAASDKAYGAQASLPYREDQPLAPTFPYEASKAAADLIARSYWHAYELPVAVTRFANLYGGGDLNPSRLVPEAVAAALAGRAPVIRSDGTPERDFLYVEDAVTAYLAICSSLDAGPGRGEAFNAGHGRGWSVKEVVAAICTAAGTQVKPEIRGLGTPRGEIDRQWADASKVEAMTGWRPRYSLREGIERTVAWYRDHPEALGVAPRAPVGA